MSLPSPMALCLGTVLALCLVALNELGGHMNLTQSTTPDLPLARVGEVQVPGRVVVWVHPAPDCDPSSIRLCSFLTPVPALAP
ncbi:hypothetical protein Pcinc_033510 [Petrolisthes cinctipes]|uniref:Uncharacterized protein n=1 Tax=Petrolisthes cinctipes TaxID=88211 RepID=A0AAE1ES63_PETCI|nr:hypothetical protein Pcinc_033510 [Petrolisthes cinctipes]